MLVLSHNAFCCKYIKDPLEITSDFNIPIEVENNDETSYIFYEDSIQNFYIPEQLKLDKERIFERWSLQNSAEK